MIANHPLIMSRHELESLFPSHSRTPSPPPSEDDSYSYPEPSLTPPASPPSSPSIDQHLHHQTLFRLLPTSKIPARIQLNEWIGIALEAVTEFGGYKSGTSCTFHLKDGQTLLPLDCCLLLEHDGQISCQSPMLDQGLRVEKRALQSANWHGLEDLSAPGIGPSGRGGLEFRVVATRQEAPTTFWISIGAERDQGIVPMVLGPGSPSDYASDTTDQMRQVVRPINIPQFGSATPRVMLLREAWNNVPQGRVWDSAFALTDMFSRAVQNGIRDATPAMFAGKRILDLSAGTGLLGVFIAGLAQTELEAWSARRSLSTCASTSPTATLATTLHTTLPACRSNSSSSSTPSSLAVNTNVNVAPLPPTAVILTDLEVAMDLIHYNIAFNQQRIAPNVQVLAKELRWGEVNLELLGLEPLDAVIASDVVYEEKNIGVLLQTLYTVCTPGHTTLYLGYKRRPLSMHCEAYFFERIQEMFNVVETRQELGVHVWLLKR
ncbi:hypothetical protein BGZ99_001049 [Dissophora globulifera]|uniref:Methyltransferase-domain-containing protein n=1 Tax=Dissophora globulifera TaxID=979702 RepID=A0A9P6R499_9FUNG|nr:hypothetical protein BGZ99_001049 [Dissophora globulifera]